MRPYGWHHPTSDSAQGGKDGCLLLRLARRRKRHGIPLRNRGAARQFAQNIASVKKTRTRGCDRLTRFHHSPQFPHRRDKRHSGCRQFAAALQIARCAPG